MCDESRLSAVDRVPATVGVRVAFVSLSNDSEAEAVCYACTLDSAEVFLWCVHMKGETVSSRLS